MPLIVRGPGFRANETRSQPVVNVDLAATITELAGAKPDGAMDGRSLVRVVARPSAHRRRAILLELLGDQVFTGVRTARHAYIERGSGQVELYDLKQDPYELHNLADERSHERVSTRLAGILESLRACSGSGCLVNARRP